MPEFVLVVTAAVGIGLVASALRAGTKAAVARTWPEAPGHIVSVSAREIWLGRGALYLPVVQYRYEVGAEELAGERLGFGARGPWSSYDAALHALRREYAPGRSVTVRYNPAEASEAVLEPRVGLAVQATLGIGIVFVLGALAFAAML